MNRVGLLAALCSITLVGCQPKDEAMAAPEASATLPKSPMEGAWTIRMEDAGPNGGGMNMSLQPSLYIFSPPYYSIARVNGTAPRALWPETATREQLTEKQVRDTFNPYTSNSGRFELKGDTLIIHPSVAVSPNFMSGGADTVTFRVNGDTLELMDLASGDGASALARLKTTLVRQR